MNTHIKHCRQQYFEATMNGEKPYEIRQYDDKVEPGDLLYIREVDHELDLTGREIRATVGFITLLKDVMEMYGNRCDCDLEVWGLIDIDYMEGEHE